MDLGSFENRKNKFGENSTRFFLRDSTVIFGNNPTQFLQNPSSLPSLLKQERYSVSSSLNRSYFAVICWKIGTNDISVRLVSVRSVWP